MENKVFSDYKIADISTTEETEISNLEKSISNKSNKNIVLIAYEAKDKNEAV